MGNPYRIKSHKRIYRKSHGAMLLRGGAFVVSVLLLFGLGWALYGPVSRLFEKITAEKPPEIQDEPPVLDESVPEQEGVLEAEPEPEPAAVGVQKTAYLPTEVVRDRERLAAALAAVKAQGYDGVMVTIKEKDGTVNYPIAYRKEIDRRYTAEATFDLAAVAGQIKDAGLVPTAAVYVFEDRKYAAADKTTGVRFAGATYLWLDNAPANGGRSWLNPYSPGAQQYIEKVLADVAAAGYEEILLRSFQFPVGYSMELMDFGQVEQSKQEQLRQYGAKLEQWAKNQGLVLKMALPADSMLGGDSRGYDGDSSAVAMASVVVEANPSSFGEEFVTPELNLPNPQANTTATVQAAAQAAQRKLGDRTMAIMVSGSEVTPAQLEQAGINRYIVFDPGL